MTSENVILWPCSLELLVLLRGLQEKHWKLRKLYFYIQDALLMPDKQCHNTKGK